MKPKVIIATVIATICLIAGAGFYLLTPQSYDDCILANMPAGASTVAARFIHRSCESKFPNKQPVLAQQPSPPDPIQQQVDALNAKEPGRYVAIPADQLESWQADWKKKQLQKQREKEIWELSIWSVVMVLFILLFLVSPIIGVIRGVKNRSVLNALVSAFIPAYGLIYFFVGKHRVWP